MQRVREVVSQTRGTLRRHNGNDNGNDDDDGTSDASSSLQPLQPSSWTDQRSRMRSILRSITSSQQRRRAREQRLEGRPEAEIETDPESEPEEQEDTPHRHHHHHHHHHHHLTPSEEAGRQEVEAFLHRTRNERSPGSEAQRMRSIWEGGWMGDSDDRLARRPPNLPSTRNERSPGSEAQRMRSIWEGGWMGDSEDGERGGHPGPTTPGGREPTIEERRRDGEPIITREDILEDIAELDRREAARSAVRGPPA